jgi:predicted RNase H-like HicB family nuclease
MRGGPSLDGPPKVENVFFPAGETETMIIRYIQEAMERARYEVIRDDEPHYGEVPSLEGVWAKGKTLEECRRNLASTVEDWVLFSVAKGLPIPPVVGARIDLPERLAG